jgi:hypothetical protein
MDYATGQIVNAVSMLPVPQASIRVVDANHLYLGDGVAADNEGKFRLDSNFLFGSNLLEISSIGYATVWVSPESFASYNVLGLYTKADDLPEVIVTPGNNKNFALLMAGGAIGFAMIIGDDKKKRHTVNGPAGALVSANLLNDPVVKYVAIGGAVIILAKVFGLAEDLLQFLGLSKSKDSAELDETANDPYSWWSPTFYKSVPVGQQALILSATTADNYVKKIYDAFGAFNDNEEQAIGVFKLLKTRSQGSFLAAKFQEKYNSDLLTFLRGGSWPQDRLSDEDVNAINNFINALPKFIAA